MSKWRSIAHKYKTDYKNVKRIEWFQNKFDCSINFNKLGQNNRCTRFTEHFLSFLISYIYRWSKLTDSFSFFSDIELYNFHFLRWLLHYITFTFSGDCNQRGLSRRTPPLHMPTVHKGETSLYNSINTGWPKKIDY